MVEVKIRDSYRLHSMLYSPAGPRVL